MLLFTGHPLSFCYSKQDAFWNNYAGMFAISSGHKKNNSPLQPDGKYNFRMDGKFSSVFGVITAVQVWKICIHFFSFFFSWKIFACLLRIEIKMCMNFIFWPHWREFHLKEGIASYLPSWRSPWGGGVEWKSTFLHVALIKPSVEGKTGLDSRPFPTSTQLVHL